MCVCVCVCVYDQNCAYNMEFHPPLSLLPSVPIIWRTW